MITFYALQIDQSGLGLPALDQYFNDSSLEVEAYQTYMRTVAKIFGATETRAKRFAVQTYYFEKDLAKVGFKKFPPTLKRSTMTQRKFRGLKYT